MTRAALGAVAALWTATAAANEPPLVQHQPSTCTVVGKPVRLCANVTDDGQVTKVRLFFRPDGDRYYSFVEMAFGGLDFCGVLPAPRPKKAKAIEYYVQAVDEQLESARGSTYRLNVLPEAGCEFPPIEEDPTLTGSITVYATHRKQGKKLPDDFQAGGVSFVPMAR